MRWPIKQILMLWMMSIIAIAIAVGIGRQQPPSKLLAHFHLTDCKLPCWIGIVPGVTTKDEALKRLEATYNPTYDLRIGDSASEFGSVNVETIGPDGLGGENYVTINLLVDRNEPHIIQRIDFRNSQLPTTVELLSVLGSPSRLRLPGGVYGPDIFFLDYVDTTYFVTFGILTEKNKIMDWNALTLFLSISAPPYDPRDDPTNTCPGEVQSWRGFLAPVSYMGTLDIVC